jgi:hypothetical protein
MLCHTPEDPILFSVSNLHFTKESKKCSDTQLRANSKAISTGHKQTDAAGT